MKYFDVESYLTSKNIPFVQPGKNVSSGWIGLKCFWCGDKSTHLGVNLETKVFTCWRCSKKGNAVEMVKFLDHTSTAGALEIISNYTLPGFKQHTKNFSHVKKFSYPKEFTDLNPHQKNYLQKRNYSPDHLVEKYKVCSGGITGEFKNRIIIPIIENNQIIGFTSRSINKHSNLRYKHNKNELNVIPSSDWVYNVDDIHCESVLVMEGPTDVWRFGSNCVCIFTSQYSLGKIKKIMSKGIKNLFIMFDNSEAARGAALRMAEACTPFFETVETVDLINTDDPAELSEDEMLHIKRELKLL